jgi:hypothetical protein
MEILINLLVYGVMAWIAYRVVEELNKRDSKVQFNPVVHACIAFLFGIFGMCCSAGYIAVKSYQANK